GVTVGVCPHGSGDGGRRVLRRDGDIRCQSPRGLAACRPPGHGDPARQRVAGRRRGYAAWVHHILSPGWQGRRALGLRDAGARRPGGRVGTPLRRVLGGLVLAAGVWTAAFRGPRSQFWLRMTLGVGGLGAYALLSEPALRQERPRGRDIAMGFGSAVGLYGI